MPLIILIGWICLPGAAADDTNDPVYNISLDGMTVQSTTNLPDIFAEIAPMPSNSIEIQSAGIPPPLYFQVRLNISKTNNVVTLTPSVFLSLQASGPYDFLGNIDGISITNPALENLFFRTSFNPTDTNISYVDPYTFKWVAPAM